MMVKPWSSLEIRSLMREGWMCKRPFLLHMQLNTEWGSYTFRHW